MIRLRAALALATAVAACGGDPQVDLAGLCAAGRAACPVATCPGGPELDAAWRRAIARVSMATPAGRAVRAAAYQAAPGHVEEAVRDAAVSAGLSWDCPTLAWLDAATRTAHESAAPLLDEATALFATAGADLLSDLAHFVSSADPRFATLAAGMTSPADPVRDAADTAAAKRLGDAISRFCKRDPSKCGAAVQAGATLLTRLAPHDAAGQSLLAGPGGRPLLVDEAIAINDDMSRLDARLGTLDATTRARAHALFSGVLAPALGAQE